MADDDDLFDEEPDDSELVKRLRKEIDERNKQIKGFGKKEEELNSLREFKTTYETKQRVSEAANVLPEGFQGLADIFAEKHEGELSKEAAEAFLRSRGLAAKPPEEEKPAEEVPPAAQAQTFTPTVAGQPPNQKIELSEVDRLMAQGQYDQAAALLQKGIKQGSIEGLLPEAAQVADSLRGR